MRLSKEFLTLLILLVAGRFCFGQDSSPKAQLVDRFSTLKCGEWRGRLDSFFIELHDNPSLTGYAVISSGKNSFKKGLAYENIIQGHAEIRKFDSKSFNIIRVDKEPAEVEFWKVSPGAEKPTFAPSQWSIVLASGTKPFEFGSTYNYPDCHNFSARLYADYLLANPGARGNIVVYYNSIGEGEKEGKFWLQIMTEDFKIPRNRFRFFYRKSKDPAFPGIEFWLVPKKAKVTK